MPRPSRLNFVWHAAEPLEEPRQSRFEHCRRAATSLQTHRYALHGISRKRFVRKVSGAFGSIRSTSGSSSSSTLIVGVPCAAFEDNATTGASQPGVITSKSPACSLRDLKFPKTFRPTVIFLKSSACPPDRKTHLRLWFFRGDGRPNIKLHMLFVPATEALTSRAGRGDTIWGQGPGPTNFTKLQIMFCRRSILFVTFIRVVEQCKALVNRIHLSSCARSAN